MARVVSVYARVVSVHWGGAKSQRADPRQIGLGASIPGERWVEESCPNVSSKSLHRTKKNRGQFLWTTGLLGSNFTRNQTSPWIHEVLQQLRRVAKKMRLPEISFDHRWFKCCLNLQKSSKEHFCVLTGKPKSSRADHRGRPKPAGPHLDKTQLRTKAVSACALPGSETSHTGLHQQARGKINLWFWLKCLN
jgi:hypothetical protein